ncbi:hypothetical protein BO71DRAFT_401855 [Aspergillus ellipticus CBS 707.79]|uniref:Uncharacterized protein n=1 Tax=Aspergillus ellipticus CBS 707.79 TaxID=1448320 RepID=A0A319D0Q8_9EURO|nr:hypothetical protein BO71DRAFT_401855 [Aspergillus ellipticus CBS 707.79]
MSQTTYDLQHTYARGNTPPEDSKLEFRDELAPSKAACCFLLAGWLFTVCSNAIYLT